MPEPDSEMSIPVVDLFAGPGGLGEGFQAASRLHPAGGAGFDVVLSFEKDKHAVRTLGFRKAYHTCARLGVLDEYFNAVEHWARERGEPDERLFQRHPEIADEATNAVREVTLAENTRTEVAVAVGRKTGDTPWVLVGGPPCQAYSIVGRARNAGNSNYDASTDARQTLYEEYLHVLAACEPEVFVLENVKGLLSASVEDRWIFGRMLRDLSDPAWALHASSSDTRPRYRIYSVVTGEELRPPGDSQLALNLGTASQRISYEGDLRAAVVRMEEYGIPQARHRVLLLGVRADLRQPTRDSLKLRTVRERATVADVISDLPAVRSRVSDGNDSANGWQALMRGAALRDWERCLRAANNGGSPKRVEQLLRRIENTEVPRAGSGARLIPEGFGGRRTSVALPRIARERVLARWVQNWRSYYRCNIPAGFGYANHESRSHMASDVQRYVFASAYAWLNGERSPRLSDFPPSLLPQHRNVSKAITTGHFSDRFRVQLAAQPARTVTSHIHKDGHYFIHFDPTQGRSLTVREAARLQTFPDSYVFLGPRTEQFRQVGNAVPPKLAAALAEIVKNIMASV